MSDIEQVNETFKSFISQAENLKSTLEHLKKFKNVEELQDKVALTDYAQLNASMAYSLNSLYYMYMKINGISMEDHKIHGEIERIKERFDRIQETITNERVRKNPNEVNTDAANRMIKHHLQSNQNQEEMKGEDDLWNEVTDHRGKKKQHPQFTKIPEKKAEKIEIEDEESSDEDLEKDLKDAKKKGKKLHKGSLLPSGTHLSWKDEIEKMLK